MPMRAPGYKRIATESHVAELRARLASQGALASSGSPMPGGVELAFHWFPAVHGGGAGDLARRFAAASRLVRAVGGDPDGGWVLGTERCSWPYLRDFNMEDADLALLGAYRFAWRGRTRPLAKGFSLDAGWGA